MRAARAVCVCLHLSSVQSSQVTHTHTHTHILSVAWTICNSSRYIALELQQQFIHRERCRETKNSVFGESFELNHLTCKWLQKRNYNRWTNTYLTVSGYKLNKTFINATMWILTCFSRLIL